VVKSGLIPQTHNNQDLGHANNKFANAHISNLAGAVQINSAFTLPTTDGSTGNVLQTDGSGNITWADLAAVTFSDTAPSSPQSGDLWFDSGTNAELFIWTGTEWISTTGGDQAAFTLKQYTGDNTTTVFNTGAGSNVRAFVYLNGVLLKETTDYSFASGTLTFVTAPFTNDNIQVMLHGAASYFDLASIGGNTDDITEGSTNLYYTDARVQAKLGTISGHILPDTDDTYDIGSASNKIRDLYLGSSTLHIGDADVTSTGTKIELPTGSTIGGAEAPQVNLTIAPEVLEINVDAPDVGQDTMWKWTWEQSTLPYARRTITNSNELNVPLYKEGTYTVNNFAAYDIHGSMSQTHSLYLKWVDGAGTDNLISWATSSGPISDTHPNINGGNATDVQRISVSVPATITPPTLTNPSVSYSVVNSGSGSYTFSGAASGDNPNLGPFYRGGTYTVNITATGHPFYFTTDNGANFSAGTYFGEYTSGVTGSRNDTGSITFTVPAGAPDTLYYQCGNHSIMRGEISIKDLAVETNINGNYVVYFQHTQEGHKTPVELRPIPSLVNQMCLVYDSTTNRFVPQDLATYVENTPSFENKIREVAGTAELVVEDGSAVIAKVNVYDDSTYLPLAGNNAGDQAFATDTNILYIWDGTAWQQAGTTNSDDLTEGSTNIFFTDERVDDRLSNLLVGGNNITATYDDTAGTLTLDGQPGYTDSDVATYLGANDYDTATNIVATITDSAPGTLDTLNELAAALGDDPNFATTTANNIATKLPLAGGTMTGDLQIYKATPIITLQRSDNATLPGLSWQGAGGSEAASIKLDGTGGATNTLIMSTYNGSTMAERLRLMTNAAGGIAVTGTISVTGTVDGRDVATDGTKLDGIESGATADQTKADIDALNIDAATVDGLDSTQFLRSDADDTTSGNLTVQKNIKSNGGFIINSSTISDSYTIANGENAMSTGPIVLGANVVITLDPGSRWVVV